MKISLKWLTDYIDIEDYLKTPEALADLLTRSGLEVESIENKAKDFENVVIGLILEKDKHPNADKLSLCRVTTGQGVVHQIVCGAQNHKTGDRVIVALPGAILPGNFSIQKSVIRNVESYGMLCSYKELGLLESEGGKSNEGIAILPAEANVGQPYSEYKGLNDVIFEIKVTPNRADVLSHFGLARELSCLLNKELKNTNHRDEGIFRKEKSTKKRFHLEVENPDLCPRYTGRFIENVKVGPSPAWLKQRLEALGLKSINNIVDVTNFILQDMGQPLHAFDADLIPNSKIKVGLSSKNEKFITLDGTEITLTGEELSIKNENNETLCLAGLIGGKTSGVSEATKNIFLESAYFLPHSVRKTSRTLGIETESGYRFARGIDPNLALRALDRAAFLIHQVSSPISPSISSMASLVESGGEASACEVYADEYDIYTKPNSPKVIEIPLATLTERIGYEAKADLFMDWMKRLSCRVERIETGDKKNEIIFQVTPPSFRVDLESDMDLVEEYARLQGYEHIPETLPALSFKPTSHDPVYVNMIKSAKVIKGYGFSHGFNYSFIGEKDFLKFNGPQFDYSELGFEKIEALVRLKNPLNEDLNIMRPLLTYGLFKNALSNIRYGHDNGKLFEMGKVFQSTAKSFKEKQNLALVAWGAKRDLWKSTPEAPPIFMIKEAVEGLLNDFRVKSYGWKQIEPSKVNESADIQLPDYLHPYQTAVLMVEGRKRGFISTFHPLILEEEKIRVPIAFGEFDFDNIIPIVSRVKRVQNISRYPVVERDLALLAESHQSVESIFTVIRKIVAKHLLNLEVFDIYQGENLEKGKKSVALRIRFQDFEKTLDESTVNQYQEQILKKLNESFQITLR
jgi:phenylalanyl-tRNA synthetase beta chain